MRACLTGVLTLMLVSCVDPEVDPHKRALDRYFGIRPSSESAWGDNPGGLVQHYDPSSGAVCLYGEPYQTGYLPGTENKVIIYLQGGGACFDAASCAVGTANTAPDFRVLDGIFSAEQYTSADDEDRALARKLRGYHTLMAPYCDGSLFGGDADVRGPTRTRFHHGLQNLSAALMAIKSKVPHPDQVVLMGESAGGYGTLLAMEPTLLAFPDSPVYVVNDSGPGLMNGHNRLQRADTIRNWNIDETVPASCRDCDPHLTPLVPLQLETFPNLKRVGLYSSQGDLTIRTFLLLTPQGYNDALMEETNKVRQREPDRFKRFIVPGHQHTILLRPLALETRVNNVKFTTWVNQLISDDPAWDDVVTQ